jgi:hypothetical protein
MAKALPYKLIKKKVLKSLEENQAKTNTEGQADPNSNTTR